MGSIPLPYAIGAIWSLPLGLLLQKETDGNQPMHASYSSSSSLLNTRDLSRPNKELLSSQIASNLFSPFDHPIKGDAADGSSHLILKHPLEEPQVSIVFFSYQLIFLLFISFVAYKCSFIHVCFLNRFPNSYLKFETFVINEMYCFSFFLFVYAVYQKVLGILFCLVNSSNNC